MFSSLQPTAGDPLLALMTAYKADSRPEKIDLGVGVYKDENGHTPVLATVKKAEAILLETQDSKSYIGTAGAPALGKAIEQLLLPASYPGRKELLESGRVATVQTPGGTGALRIAADFIHRSLPNAKIWVSAPTWANHFNVFQSAGLEVKEYRYYDQPTQSLDFAGMMAALEAVPAGDVVLLHACCHNPTGLDLTAGQWEQVATLLKERGIMPFVDAAYIGFAESLEEDTKGINILADHCPDMLVAASCSKNFGLYNERIGSLTLIAANERDAQAGFSQINYCIRGNYSMPPNHGAAIVSTILNSPDLRAEWEDELAAMRSRILEMRLQFVETLSKLGVKQDFGFIAKQRGMFSFSSLSPEIVKKLQVEDAIYIVGSGRINVAGMTPSNIDRLCQAIARLLD
ncbi:amino acid aminotransferase [Motiliproteus sp. MSK22-1]|uniref:amino acid aminotransferase n=1 Tax=Motiliproteus sp. MSK22-1 TaxID=1897630 RepID=UPI000978A8FB|nr:amino acid aminotransferase [Motiliproteus sp. MSK22-1]OMH29049.1 aromatic amino acid aminotransferase [Motiliproteus sp. MSK22-1]